MALNESRWLKGKHEEYSVEQEDTTRGNPIVEAIFKTRWNIPILSEYTSAIGKMAKKADVGVEKRSLDLAQKGILWEYNAQTMRHGTRKTTTDNWGGKISELGIQGYPKAMDMASFVPFIGDPETGKYSLFDAVLAGTEAIPIAKSVSKSGAKFINRFEPFKTRKSIKEGKKIYEQKKDKFYSDMMTQILSGGNKTLKEAKSWTKKWAMDPETFVRNKGARLDEGGGAYLSDKPTLERALDKLDIERPPSIKETGLSEEAYYAKYQKQHDAITEVMKSDLLDYTTSGKTEKQIDLFVQMARDPKTTAKDMADFGFENEYKSYKKYVKDIEKRIDKIKPSKDDVIPHLTEDIEIPDLDLPETNPGAVDTYGNILAPSGKEELDWVSKKLALSKEPRYGFMPMSDRASGYYIPQRTVAKVDIVSTGTKSLPGAYREKVVIDAAIVNKADLRSVAVHEFQHYLTKGNVLIPEDISRAMNSLLRGDIDGLMDFWKANDLKVRTSKGKRTTAKNATDDEIGEQIDYYIQHTEMQARMQEIRRDLNVRPGQKITKKDLDRFVNKSDIIPGEQVSGASRQAFNDLLNVWGSKSKLAKALNTLPALVPLVPEEELFNQWDMEDNLF